MTRARNSKGRFTKRASVSITKRRSCGPLVVRETRIQVPRRRRGAAGGSTSNRTRGGVAVAGFVLGYVNKNYSATISKVPAIKGSYMLTLGAAGHFLLKPRPGSALDHAVTAACAIGGYELGTTGISGDDTDASWR